ncbi:hypothetical protein [Streptomyces sp. BBFR109]|uniref:hypothetical protein n=1 Tax=Streptomyces sp. BBFR109 TaxID=3448172 RepID=UPI003F76175C
MTSRITAYMVGDALADAGHTDATRGPAWRRGYRAYQASPRTVRLWHDGPDEQDHLDRYAKTLRAIGYTVNSERKHRKRPALRVTHP